MTGSDYDFLSLCLFIFFNGMNLHYDHDSPPIPLLSGNYLAEIVEWFFVAFLTV